MVPARVDGLVTHASDIADAPAAGGLLKVREAAPSLPNDPDAMFSDLLAMPQSELLSRLAVCVASTVGAVCSRETEMPATSLAQALGLDMHDWWTPTAAGCFEHVSKAKALEAVLVFAPEHVARLSKLKKGDLASEAERLATGTGWLPAMLCKPKSRLVGRQMLPRMSHRRTRVTSISGGRRRRVSRRPRPAGRGCRMV